jgi:hypothetical protein
MVVLLRSICVALQAERHTAGCRATYLLKYPLRNNPFVMRSVFPNVLGTSIELLENCKQREGSNMSLDDMCEISESTGKAPT